jgi:hypothetical protein
VATKTLSDALIEAHVSLIYARAGLAVAIAGGEPTVAMHQTAINANAVRLNALADVAPVPADLAGLVGQVIDADLEPMGNVVAKYTLIRDDPETAALLYLGTDGFDDPQPIIDSAATLYDAIVAARTVHLDAGLPIPALP